MNIVECHSIVVCTSDIRDPYDLDVTSHTGLKRTDLRPKGKAVPLKYTAFYVQLDRIAGAWPERECERRASREPRVGVPTRQTPLSYFMSTDPGTSPRAGLGARARATTTTRSSAPPEPRSPGQEALVILVAYTLYRAYTSTLLANHFSSPRRLRGKSTTKF